MLELTGIFGFILLAANIYAIFRIVQSSATDVAKAVWIAVLFFLPFLGFIAWLLFGPSDRAVPRR